jgi:hypothetical protein
MTENEEFIYDSIFSQIRMGFISLSDIKENIIEEIEDNIEKEWKKFCAESKQWKQPTDTDRLIKAFDELCDTNIIALHNAGFTNRDGEYEVVEVETELQKNNIQSNGYCFYHEQDLSRALDVDNPMLFISFQKVENKSDVVTIEIGKKIVQILKNNTFEIIWDETAQSRICIPNFKWQLIYTEEGRDLLDYKQVVQRMIK